MTVSASPRLGKRLRAVLRQARALPGAAIARAVTRTARARHFSGAFDTRAAAQEAVIRRGGQGYDDAAISEVSFDLMCQRTAWDYPVMFWLQRFLPDADALIDAGGHFGTKYIAFQDLIDLRPIRWNVYDLPAIVHAARRRQGRGGLLQQCVNTGADLWQIHGGLFNCGRGGPGRGARRNRRRTRRIDALISHRVTGRTRPMRRACPPRQRLISRYW